MLDMAFAFYLSILYRPKFQILSSCRLELCKLLTSMLTNQKHNKDITFKHITKLNVSHCTKSPIQKHDVLKKCTRTTCNIRSYRSINKHNNKMRNMPSIELNNKDKIRNKATPNKKQSNKQFVH